MTTEPRRTEQEPGLAPVKARQGVISGRVLTVLTVSLILSFLGMLIAYFVVL